MKVDTQGKQMIYPWTLNGFSSGVLVYLELDNRKCSDSENTQCFTMAAEVSIRSGCRSHRRIYTDPEWVLIVVIFCVP